MDYTLCLLQPDIRDVDVLLVYASALAGFTEVPLNPAIDVGDAVVRAFARPGKPSETGGWKDFVCGCFGVSEGFLLSISPAAVVFISVYGRLFAIPFGQGRHAIPDDLIEEDFGITCVLNTAKGQRLHHLSVVTPGARRKSVAVTRNYEGEVSELVPGRRSDLLAEAAGNVEHDGVDRKVSGRQSLRMQVPPDMVAIVEDCKTALSWFQSEEPKDLELAALSASSRVRDEAAVGRLNEELHDLLVGATDCDVSIADLEDEGEEIIAREIRIGRGDWTTVPEFSMSWFRQWWRLSGYTASDLAKDIVRLTYADGGMRLTTIIRLISAVIRRDSVAFFAERGVWYRTSRRYIDSVDSLIGSIEAMPDNFLPPFGDDGHFRSGKLSEGAYNSVVASDLGFVNCDVPDKRFRGETEVCDLLTPAAEFIHVKRRANFASVAYVTSQAFVSADRLCSNSEYREFVSGLGNGIAFVKDPGWNRQRVKVVVALISPNAVTAKGLSFNCRRELARLAEDLQRLGLRLALLSVADRSSSH